MGLSLGRWYLAFLPQTFGRLTSFGDEGSWSFSCLVMAICRDLSSPKAAAFAGRARDRPMERSEWPCRNCRRPDRGVRSLSLPSYLPPVEFVAPDCAFAWAAWCCSSPLSSTLSSGMKQNLWGGAAELRGETEVSALASSEQPADSYWPGALPHEPPEVESDESTPPKVGRVFGDVALRDVAFAFAGTARADRLGGATCFCSRCCLTCSRSLARPMISSVAASRRWTT
mmetsp:Transcript_51054/g.150528  ORF Transcript_51054/g.150528 Transcript_51054/m.150528 type:complete len:228 (+) Transcript_51054:296-979(+)